MSEDSEGWVRGTERANCVEVRQIDSKHVAMRDSRHPEAVIPVLRGEFSSFVAAVKRGEFDRFTG